MRKIIIPVVFLFFTLVASAQFKMSEGTKKIVATMTVIENMYVDPVDDKKLADDAVRGLLEKLDPHSTYITSEEAKEMNEPLEGNFDGIGIAFNMMTDTLYVIETIAGGPSEKVGVRAGDKIIYASDTLIAGVKKKTKDVMALLKGPKGTTVKVRILRKGEPQLLDFKITRAKIPIYSLDAAYMIDKNIGYIQLSRFGATTLNEFQEACVKLKAQGMENLILDLQNNGGGYLSAAIELSDEFLQKDKLIVYTEGTKQSKQVSLATSKGNFEKGKLVVLINEGSASASEILSGAMQDWDRGIVVGRRSFGKGLVQRQIPLPDESMLRLTVARYYTPTGRSIQRPYTNGDANAYNRELIDRYNKGEMMHADSIHFPDSLKYKTLVNKRIVYGGGGIMPDNYVPLDTLAYPPYFRKIVGKGITYRVAHKIVDEQRKEILSIYKKSEDYVDNFQVMDDIMKKVLEMAAEEKVEFSKSKELTMKDKKTDVADVDSVSDTDEKIEFDEEEYNQSKGLIANHIKAYIGRDLYNTETQIKIINQQSDIYKKGYEIINDTKLYDDLLKGTKLKK